MQKGVNNQCEHSALSLALSPSGKLHLDFSDSTEERLSINLAETIKTNFTTSYINGLLYLGVINFASNLPPSFVFWQKFSRLFIARICHISGAQEISSLEVPVPKAEELEDIIQHSPPMIGVEYLRVDVLVKLWQELIIALKTELEQHYDNSLQNYFKAHNSTWNLVGRVCFHLAENKNDPNLPFAFLATYTDKLLSGSNVRHLPLGNALQEYAGEKNRSSLLGLLLPVQKAAAQSALINKLAESREIFRPLVWSPKEAYQFLQDIPVIEAAGVVVRVPNWWNPTQPSRPKVSVSVGEKPTSQVGMSALLDFNMHIALSDGEKLTEAELKQLLDSTENLVKVKGKWVEIDRQKLTEVLEHWQQIQKHVKRDGLSFAEGLRLLAGISSGGISDDDGIDTTTREWSVVNAGDWLLRTLKELRNPESDVEKQLADVLSQYLNANLRPYQTAGVKWLWLLYSLKLGGCLADDMGLGKTIQILSLILLIKYNKQKTLPHLLVVPASLLANWQAEILRFTPSIKFLVIHSSVLSNKDLNNFSQDSLHGYDLVITTYGFAQRLNWLAEIAWDMVILDEAQTIKNSNTKQTRIVKTFKNNIRFILTGTPIENKLMDLWSLFDFATPGLLGTSKTFLQYNKRLKGKNKQQIVSPNDALKKDTYFLTAVRSLVRPYILRRLKSDKSIIADLPDKTELKSFCTLTKPQIGLYQKAFAELAQTLKEVTDGGIKRRGIVLSYILRFKQICNHPAQLLGHGTYDHNVSGKFLRLKELCEEIAAKQEKVLVFTQFREIIPGLEDFLTTVFGRSGLVLHGATAVKQRAELVRAFQEEQGPPFFILSLKAGGTGLNLTGASHVIHFDRWWNPAVENQATDRAYRIGQKKNVLVHKFICRGTIEEKIDALIDSKKDLSNEILTSGAEIVLTEMSNEELMKVVTLDVNRALMEE